MHVGEHYPWLTIHDDGTIGGANLDDTTLAEADRRVVIAQELWAGRVVLAEQHAGAVTTLVKIATLHDDHKARAVTIAQAALAEMGVDPSTYRGQ